MILSRRNRELRTKLYRYLDAVRENLQLLRSGMRHYTEHGLDPHFERLVEQIHTVEHDADNIRREVEVDLFAKSLLPDSREDILLLLERVDLIPNQAEDVLRQLYVQNIAMPPCARDGWQELAEVGIQAFALVASGIQAVLEPSAALDLQDIIRRIDDAERVGDKIEQRLVFAIFRADLSQGEKILARDMVYATGQLCDHAQDVGIFLTVFSVKRQA